MAAVSSETIVDGLKKGKIEKLSEEIQYLRFRDGFRGIERGTVIAGRRVIWGFPHIKRIFTLEMGLKKNMKSKFVTVEEKIDGFNVRIAAIEDKVYAFSRGGFLDAFVTEKAREMRLEKNFRENPDYVLCGEMIGNTPYTTPTKDFDVKLFVFDIDYGDGSYLPCEQKYSLIKKYGIDGVPILGKVRVDDYKALHSIAIAINKGRKEGMVLKSMDRKNTVKYVTPWADVDDIANASEKFFDMPIGFYYQRVLRSAFFIKDFALDKEEYSRRLGDAFYNGLSNALKKVDQGREIDEEFEIAIKDLRIWDDIKKHMSREVKLEELWRKNENGKTRIRFRKIYKKTTKTLTAYVGGKGITD